MIGLIFAMYSIPVVFLSPVVSQIIDQVGRAQLVAYSLGSMGIFFIFFGLIEYI